MHTAPLVIVILAHLQRLINFNYVLQAVGIINFNLEHRSKFGKGLLIDIKINSKYDLFTEKIDSSKNFWGLDSLVIIRGGSFNRKSRRF